PGPSADHLYFVNPDQHQGVTSLICLMAAALRSDPPIAQRLDREDNREPTGHSEDIQSPDEQQGAALLEKLRAQSIPHVQRQHSDGHHAAQEHDHLARWPFSQQNGTTDNEEEDRDADK